jgi:hypothetical protein
LTGLLQTRNAGSPSTTAFVLLSLPAFVFLLIVYVLPPPLPITPDPDFIDPSWQIVVTSGFLHGAQFGRDIVYTYGPWGFLAAPRGDPRIYPWLFGGRFLIALAFVFGTTLVAIRRIRWRPGRFLFVLWIAILGDPVSVLPMILLAAMLSPRKEVGKAQEPTFGPVIHLMVIACALTVWMKVTGLCIVGALALALAVQDLVRRRLPVISMEIVAFALAFWLLARQSLSGLGLFLHGALAGAMSYSAAMFSDGPAWEIRFAGLLLLVLAVPVIIRFRRGGMGLLWPSVGWVALLFFLQIKEAFVRHDPFHVWMGITTALLPCALILLCLTGAFDSDASEFPRIRVINHACAAWTIFLSVVFLLIQSGSMAGLERRQFLAIDLAAAKALVNGETLSAQYQRQLAEYRRAEPLEDVGGTVAFFPDHADILYGNGLKVRLPPVPQAFSAYNAYLSARNASFYRSAGRPDFVFFDVASIDNRYPTSSDMLSWLALMDCYEPHGNSGSYLVLGASGCRHARLEFIAGSTTQAGKIVSVPGRAGYAVWVQFNIRLNMAGSMITMLARPPLTELTVRTGTGQSTFRISAEAAAAGFLLSPLIRKPASFGSLFTDRELSPATEVRELIRVQPSGARKFYEPAIDVRFYAMRVPGNPTERAGASRQ